MTLTAPTPGTLASRLGLTVHESLLKRRLLALLATTSPKYPGTFEDWLLEIANARGIRIVMHPQPALPPAAIPDVRVLPNEELAAGICLVENCDRPHLLRLTAQMISRETVQLDRFSLLVRQERIEPVIGPMTRAALRVDPEHPAWQALARRFPQEPPRDEPVIHWTRLAEPLFAPKQPNAIGWKLHR